MKHFLSTTALATALAIGGYGLAGAQSGGQSGGQSQSGGAQSQSGASQGQPGGAQGQPGSSQSRGGAAQGQPGTNQQGTNQQGTNQQGTAQGQAGGTTGQRGTSQGPASATQGQSGTAQGQSGTASNQGSAGMMNEDAVRASLQARGYSNIERLEREGDTFRVRQARRYGEEVEELRINPRTGQVQGEKRLTENQARNLLRDRGYADVSDVRREGNDIMARAKQNDRNVQLRVDAMSGAVTQQGRN